MKTALIFHGTGGSSTGNWFPWLKSELETRGYLVKVPQFPNPDKPSFINWLAELEKYQSLITKDCILIGHSLGGLFLLRVLERLDEPVRGAFFVAAPIGIKPIRYYDSDKSFSGFEFDWDKITSNAKFFAVFHSDNDPYVCLENGKELAKHLDVKLNFVPSAGHLNAESGYTELIPLLEEIEQLPS